MTDAEQRAGKMAGRFDMRTRRYRFFPIIYWILFSIVPPTYAHASDGAGAAPGPTAVCPSLNDAKYELPLLDDPEIKKQQNLSITEVATQVCSVFGAMVSSGATTTSAIESFSKALYKELNVAVTPDCQASEITRYAGAPGQVRSDSIQTGGISWATAIAKMLAKRAESEMQAWLVDSIVTDVCESDVQYYFPHFCLASRPFAEGTPPSYSSMAKTFQEDLKSLPACLIMKNSSRDREWAYPAMNLYREIRRKTPPLRAVAGLADSTYIEDSCATGREDSCALYISGIATYAYVTTSKKVDEKLTVAELIARAYIKMGSDKNKYELMTLLTPTNVTFDQEAFKRYKERIDDFNDIVKRIEVRIKRIQELKNEGPEYQEEMLQMAFEVNEKVAEAITAAQSIFGKEGGTKPLIGEHTMARIRQVASILAAAETGRYRNATAEIEKIINCVSEKEIPPHLAHECRPWSDIRDKAAQANKDALDALVQYTPLAAELANAKTTDDVTAALDRAASPTGAWRLKRERGMVSIGALVGGTAGRERLDGAPTGRERGSFSALFAPVGVDISTQAGSWTAGFFLSLIDVGNLMSVSLSDGDAIKVNEESNTSFRQVFSPGAYVRFGVGKSPLVLGFGIAKTPGLRNAELPDGTSIELDSTRISAFIAIDIPLLPLF